MAVNNEAFSAGLNHLANAGKANDSSLTMASARWNDSVGNAMTTPHSVLSPLAFSGSQSANGTAGANFIPGFGTIGNSNGQSNDNLGAEEELRYVSGDQNAELD